MSGVIAAPRRARFRRFAVNAGLYVAQAIPSYLLAAAIPPIMREAGVSCSAIGYFSVLFLKFLWGPWVDWMKPFARAHRAGWVVLIQFGVIGCILALNAVSPSHVTSVLAIGFVAALLVSTQDIATDGYAAEDLPPADRAIGNAIQDGSIAFCMIIRGMLGLVLHHRFGWHVMLLTTAAISMLPLLAASTMREKPPTLEWPCPSLSAFLYQIPERIPESMKRQGLPWRQQTSPKNSAGTLRGLIGLFHLHGLVAQSC